MVIDEDGDNADRSEPWPGSDGVLWCEDSLGGLEIKYIRADKMAEMMIIELDYYDAGLLGDYGGGNVDWWQNYMRDELKRAHEFYQSQVFAAYPSAPEGDGDSAHA
jgi:hypothetical protein